MGETFGIRVSRAVATLALLAAASGSQAAVVTETRNFDFSLGAIVNVTNNAGRIFDASASLEYDLPFSLFDPSLGTLTAVDIALNGILSVSYTLARNHQGNPAAQELTVAVDSEAGFLLQGPGAGDESASAPHDAEYSLSRNGSVQETLDDLLASGNWSFTGTDVDPFAGSGGFSIGLFARLLLQVTGPVGSSLTVMPARWWGEASVTYTYEPPVPPGGATPTGVNVTAVPEPSALLLAGIGLVGLALHFRRRPVA